MAVCVRLSYHIQIGYTIHNQFGKVICFQNTISIQKMKGLSSQTALII